MSIRIRREPCTERLWEEDAGSILASLGILWQVTWTRGTMGQNKWQCLPEASKLWKLVWSTPYSVLRNGCTMTSLRLIFAFYFFLVSSTVTLGWFEEFVCTSWGYFVRQKSSKMMGVVLESTKGSQSRIKNGDARTFHKLPASFLFVGRWKLHERRKKEYKRNRPQDGARGKQLTRDSVQGKSRRQTGEDPVFCPSSFLHVMFSCSCMQKVTE